MKKQIFIIILLLMGGVSTFGQYQISATGANDMRLRTNNTDRVNILTNGNVGIGTSTPASKLHIRDGASGATPYADANLIVESNQYTVLNLLSPATGGASSIFFGYPGLFGSTKGEISFNPSLNRFNFGTNGTTRMTISGNGYVGIGMIGTASTALEVTGDIRTSSLAGTGVRNVAADANGTLTTSPRTYTMVVPPQSFQRRYNTGPGTFTADGAYGNCLMFGSGATDQLIAPVSLPVGAVITGVTFYYTDTDNNNNLSMILFGTSVTVSSSFYVANLFQNTDNPNPYDISNIASGVLNESVTDGKYYYIYISPKNTTNTANTTWENQMSVKGVKITYTL